ncbi:conserved hypothetical protein [Beutenbergia cavernae DSM 12333]|uniref:DUF3073 domain-containing protein n=1 Tax=Beutenbergia cavernae (strain ATCC BAA-8 / DSM 12333 / CCUG 43141 / JCM 11478 / NBRC 16432 / NCIMB 13614 / HKI 0122) TaxID=471853 RepID=C5C2R2_BEUC1|nr:DUF3073 domain-containing protein [Beutenbergia cavernae]ACQ81756.1 conserved hypothetical protein [Beutenbergia cavernae DSM 12333]
MGRGRQKAKQTKVARQLKYYSPETDYRALEKELTSPGTDTDVVDRNDEPDTEDEDWSSDNRR